MGGSKKIADGQVDARKIETVEKESDVFSKDGYYLYKAVCQHTPFVNKEGFFYTRIQNEETGEVFVKRYKIKNWEQIKEREPIINNFNEWNLNSLKS